MSNPIMTDTASPSSDADAALVVRWLCHDMASPVSTLLTASELLGAASDPEINALITAAIRRLSARLRLVRLALGNSSTMAAPTFTKLLAEALTDTPTSVDLSDDAPPANIVASATLILSETKRAAAITITDTGARWPGDIPLPDDLKDALTGKPGTDPRSAMTALAARQARAAGYSLAPEASGIAFRKI